MSKKDELMGLLGGFLQQAGEILMEDAEPEPGEDEPFDEADYGGQTVQQLRWADLVAVLGVERDEDVYDKVCSLKESLRDTVRTQNTLMDEHAALKKHVAELDKKADERIASETERLTFANTQYRREATDARREANDAILNLTTYQEGWKKYQDKASADAKRIQFLEGELVKERAMVEELRTKYHDAACHASQLTLGAEDA